MRGKRLLVILLTMAMACASAGCGSLDLPAVLLNKDKEPDEETKKEDVPDGKDQDEEKKEGEEGGKELDSEEESLFAEFTMEKFKEESQDLDYKDLVRYEEENKGAKVHFYTTIVEKMDDGEFFCYADEDEKYLIYDKRETDNTKLLKKDSLEVWGEYTGLTDVTTDEGVEEDIAVIDARYINIAGEGPEEETTQAETEAVTEAETTAAAIGSDDKYETMYVVNCNTSITLRTSPSTKAAEIRQIPLGAAVSYIETAENGFYKVTYLSDTGYALASYLSTDPTASSTVPTAAPAVSNPVYTTMYVVNCASCITLRKSASTSGGEIRQIPLGAAVTYLGSASNGFYKVTYLSDTGWALASYLSTSQGRTSISYDHWVKVVNCQQSITLRKTPSTKAGEICQMPLGSTARYIESAGNGFGLVEYNGYVGYALESYLAWY